MVMVNTKKNQMGAELLGRFTVRSYGRVWKPKIDQEELARLAVVGVGPLGARAIQMLSRIQSDLSCHEILFDPQSEGLAEVKAVLDVVRTSDLLFIVAGFEDPQCEDVFREVAVSARAVGVPVLGVVPDNQRYFNLLPFVTSIWPVSYRSLGGDLASVTPSLEGRDGGTEYALMHLVGTLTNILTHKGLIGIDYYDVVGTLKSGTTGRLAVGVASEKVSIADASLIALGLLADQGAAIESAMGGIVYLAGYYALFSIDDFDSTTIAVQQRVGKDVTVIAGVQPMEASGKTVMVTLMVISNARCNDLV